MFIPNQRNKVSRAASGVEKVLRAWVVSGSVGT
jgi:hypothetical protein